MIKIISQLWCHLWINCSVPNNFLQYFFVFFWIWILCFLQKENVRFYTNMISSLNFIYVAFYQFFLVSTNGFDDLLILYDNIYSHWSAGLFLSLSNASWLYILSLSAMSSNKQLLLCIIWYKTNLIYFFFFVCYSRIYGQRALKFSSFNGWVFFRRIKFMMHVSVL